jgi:hypothetical protein
VQGVVDALDQHGALLDPLLQHFAQALGLGVSREPRQNARQLPLGAVYFL